MRGESIGALLRRVAQQAPDRPALIEGVEDPAARRRWSYRQLLTDSERLAGALARRFAPGDRIAIWSPNVPEYQIVQYAAALAGLVIVTVNPAFRRKEAAYALGHAGVRACFTVASFRSHRLLELAHDLQPELPALASIIDLEHWDDLLDPDADRAVRLPEVDPGSAAQILYTSGTTGLPKGALLSHRAITDNVTVAAANIAGSAADRAVWLATLPMFHLAGCVMAAVGSLTLAGGLVTVRSFDAGLALELIDQERVSTTNIVPTLMWALLRHRDLDRRDLSSWHSVMLGGAPIPPELVRQVRARGIVPINGYGLTEATAISATSDGDDDHDLVETIGRPLPHVEMRIADPATGQEVAVGDVGEIETRGPHTFLGYWQNPDATEAAYRADGWLRTGDLGSMDGRGVFSMRGRATEMIIRGGENVYPREIEDHLMDLPGVLEAAVLGLPDDYYGEVVAAFLRTDASRPSPQTLTALLREELTGYKVPSRWFYVEEFPLTPSGKIQKFALRESWSKAQEELR